MYKANSPYLGNENEFLKNSFETVFRASKSYDRDQLVSAFQLTFKASKHFCKPGGDFEMITTSSAYIKQLTWHRLEEVTGSELALSKMSGRSFRKRLNKIGLKGQLDHT